MSLKEIAKMMLSVVVNSKKEPFCLVIEKYLQEIL